MIEPQQYTFRAPNLDELEAIVRVQRASSTYDFGSSSLTKEDLRQSWQSGSWKPETDAWVALDDHGEPVAYGEAPQTGEKVWGTMWVLPENRGRGVEQEMVSRFTQRTLSESHATIIYGRSTDANVAARSAYEQAGYSIYVTFQIMEIEFQQQPPEPQWPIGIEVKTFRQDQDEQETYRTDEEASLDKGYHDPLTFDEWAERMSLRSARFDPTLWFLAWSDNEAAGVALSFYNEGNGTAVVDHLGVRRPWRNKGLGKALLLHSLREFYTRGVSKVRLVVDSASLTNAPRLYSSVGMEVVQKYHIYRLLGTHT